MALDVSEAEGSISSFFFPSLPIAERLVIVPLERLIRRVTRWRLVILRAKHEMLFVRISSSISNDCFRRCSWRKSWAFGKDRGSFGSFFFDCFCLCVSLVLVVSCHELHKSLDCYSRSRLSSQTRFQTLNQFLKLLAMNVLPSQNASFYIQTTELTSQAFVACHSTRTPHRESIKTKPKIVTFFRHCSFCFVLIIQW